MTGAATMLAGLVALSGSGPASDVRDQQCPYEMSASEFRTCDSAIAAETARRVLAGARPGAWTPGQLFGAALVTDATGAQVTVR